MEDNLAKLYQVYEILSTAEKKTEGNNGQILKHAQDYVRAIEGSKGTYKEKRLTSQILPKFFKHFPALQRQAMEAMLDLCEDDDSSIRMCAIKALPSLCKEVKDHTIKVADILAQLLQLEDQDLIIVRNSLQQVFKEDPVTVTKAIFSHVQISTDTALREKCLHTLFTYLIKSLEKSNTELEDICIEESRKALQDANCFEFVELMKFLKVSKLSKSPSGQQELLKIIYEQAEVDRDFDPLEEGSNNVDRLITCIDYALPYFSAKHESNKFVMYICDQVLPQWDIIAPLEEGDLKQLQILRHLAQLSTYCGKLDNPSLHVVQIFDKIKSYMPPPPENIDVENLPNLDFSSVECLLYAFHRLARQCPDFLTHDPAVLKDFQARLMYFARVLQGCSKALTQAIHTGTIKRVNSQEKQKAKAAPKLLSNVKSLIKDLFYKPPVYKCIITLSFLEADPKSAAVSPASEPATQKRHVPITFDKSGTATKQPRSNKSSENMKLYTPPSGKFSNNFQNFDRAGGGRPRTRGRGGRGRPGGRNWRN